MRVGALAIAAIALGVSCARSPDQRVDDVLVGYRDAAEYDGLVIDYPLDETLFPPEIAPPTFRWRDIKGLSDTWLVTIKFADEGRLSFLTAAPTWTPPVPQWEEIKRRSLERAATVAVLGFRHDAPRTILSGAGDDQHVARRGRGAAVLSRGEPAVYRSREGPDQDSLAVRADLRAGAAADRAGQPAGVRELPLVLRRRPPVRHGRGLRQRQGLVRHHGGPRRRSPSRPATSSPGATTGGRMGSRRSGCSRRSRRTAGTWSARSRTGRSSCPSRTWPSRSSSSRVKGILASTTGRRGPSAPCPGPTIPSTSRAIPTWSPDGKYIVFARSQGLSACVRTRRSVLLDRGGVRRVPGRTARRSCSTCTGSRSTTAGRQGRAAGRRRRTTA